MLSFEMHIQYLYVQSHALPPPSLFVCLVSLDSTLPTEHYTQECGASERVVNVICFKLGAM